jgi:hypothetical protein
MVGVLATLRRLPRCWVESWSPASMVDIIKPLTLNLLSHKPPALSTVAICLYLRSSKSAFTCALPDPPLPACALPDPPLPACALPDPPLPACALPDPPLPACAQASQSAFTNARSSQLHPKLRSLHKRRHLTSALQLRPLFTSARSSQAHSNYAHSNYAHFNYTHFNYAHFNCTHFTTALQSRPLHARSHFTTALYTLPRRPLRQGERTLLAGWLAASQVLAFAGVASPPRTSYGHVQSPTAQTTSPRSPLFSLTQRRLVVH